MCSLFGIDAESRTMCVQDIGLKPGQGQYMHSAAAHLIGCCGSLFFLGNISNQWSVIEHCKDRKPSSSSLFIDPRWEFSQVCVL